MGAKPDTTILYYTSNRENPDFEARVRDNILKYKGDLPIISISHRPINFGYNICVGDVGVSGFNMFRQVQIGLKEADTKFVLSAEADCLYPPDYFTYIPPREDICYRDSNLYVMPDRRAFFFRKPEGATHAQIIGRNFYLNTLDKLFEGAPAWSTQEKNFPKERNHKDDIFGPEQIKMYHTKNPVFQIKTHRGMRYYTNSERIPIKNIPFWGNGEKARKFFLYGIK